MLLVRRAPQRACNAFSYSARAAHESIATRCLVQRSLRREVEKAAPAVPNFRIRRATDCELCRLQAFRPERLIEDARAGVIGLCQASALARRCGRDEGGRCSHPAPDTPSQQQADATEDRSDTRVPCGDGGEEVTPK